MGGWEEDLDAGFQPPLASFSLNPAPSQTLWES